MNLNIGTINYTAYFKYKTPTPICGTPTHRALKRLQTKLQANASSIECDLGGGYHGYLGLVLNATEYATVPGTVPFVPPNFPPVLVIPPNASHVAELQLREDHQEERRRYFECKNVKKALLRFIQEAVEDRFIEALVDEYTNLITLDIPAVMLHLFNTYGTVSSEEVHEKETKIMKMTWHPTDPLVLIT